MSELSKRRSKFRAKSPWKWMCTGKVCLKVVGFGFGWAAFFFEGLRTNHPPVHNPPSTPGFRAEKPLLRAAMLPVCNHSSSAENSRCHSHGVEWGSTHLHWLPCHRKPEGIGGERGLGVRRGSQKPGVWASSSVIRPTEPHVTTGEPGSNSPPILIIFLEGKWGPLRAFLSSFLKWAVNTLTSWHLSFSSANWGCCEN